MTTISLTVTMPTTCRLRYDYVDGLVYDKNDSDREIVMNDTVIIMIAETMVNKCFLYMFNISVCSCEIYVIKIKQEEMVYREKMK